MKEGGLIGFLILIGDAELQFLQAASMLTICSAQAPILPGGWFFTGQCWFGILVTLSTAVRGDRQTGENRGKLTLKCKK